jgi:hypothetical protein
MQIKIKEISKEKLEKNGWKYLPNLRIYRKDFNECRVCIRLRYYELPHECWIPYEEVTPEDLIAIGQELKKLEE